VTVIPLAGARGSHSTLCPHPGLSCLATDPALKLQATPIPEDPERTFGRAEVFSETSDRRVYVPRLLIKSAGPAHATPTDPARSPPAAASVAGLAPFPRDEVATEYGRSERGREDRGNAREILALKGEAAGGRWGNTALIQQHFPLRRLRRHLPRQAEDLECASVNRRAEFPRALPHCPFRASTLREPSIRLTDDHAGLAQR
jgi:hypothetical protein